MRILERLRLLTAALLCAAFLAVYGYTLFIDFDGGWPVSIYPMFSEGRTHDPFRAYRVFGVTTGPGGESEQRIYSDDLRPLDALRLLDGLTRMTPADQAEALRFVLARNPRFAKVRLYDEEWAAGGGKLLGRKLLADVPP
jgi:hypothetical protein